jgi:hypothetical protein
MNGENKMSAIKFIKDSLLAYEESQRQTGRTTRLVLKAISNGAVFVVHDQLMKHYIMREFNSHNLECITLDEYMNKDRYRGKMFQDKPSYVFDHFAEYELIQRKLKEAEFIVSKDYKHEKY